MLDWTMCILFHIHICGLGLGRSSAVLVSRAKSWSRSQHCWSWIHAWNL